MFNANEFLVVLAVVALLYRETGTNKRSMINPYRRGWAVMGGAIVFSASTLLSLACAPDSLSDWLRIFHAAFAGEISPRVRAYVFVDVFGVAICTIAASCYVLFPRDPGSFVAESTPQLTFQRICEYAVWWWPSKLAYVQVGVVDASGQSILGEAWSGSLTDQLGMIGVHAIDVESQRVGLAEEGVAVGRNAAARKRADGCGREGYDANLAIVGNRFGGSGVAVFAFTLRGRFFYVFARTVKTEWFGNLNFARVFQAWIVPATRKVLAKIEAIT
ncbi:MAG TPA: hypothetical protein VHR66_29975 [Gemmataceae bacterium]|jgi:hypothetical protein|nr:hypothetical protein [Gemmataceae bacterium]